MLRAFIAKTKIAIVCRCDSSEIKSHKFGLNDAVVVAVCCGMCRLWDNLLMETNAFSL